MKKQILRQFILLLLTGHILIFPGNEIKAQSNQNVIPIIDKNKSYPETDFVPETEVKYIPLETSKDVLLGRVAHIYYVSDSLILVTDWESGDVIFFDMNGRAVSYFNQKNGLGYNRISYAVYDEKNEEIFILDEVLGKIIVFNKEGTLKRSYRVPKNLNLVRIDNFSNNLLLAWHEHIMGPLTPEQRNPYVLISKEDGSIVSKLNIYLEKANPRYLMSGNICYTLGNTAMGNYKFGYEFYLNNMSLDTIFQLSQNKILTPVFTQHPSVFSDSDLRAGVVTVTDEFIVFSIYIYDLEEEKKRSETGRTINGKDRTKFVLYDKSTHQFYKLKGWKFVAYDIDAPKNVSARFLQPFDLINKLKLGVLKGEKKEIASKLKIDDNPVVEITKFK